MYHVSVCKLVVLMDVHDSRKSLSLNSSAGDDTRSWWLVHPLAGMSIRIGFGLDLDHVIG